MPARPNPPALRRIVLLTSTLRKEGGIEKVAYTVFQGFNRVPQANTPQFAEDGV